MTKPNNGGPAFPTTTTHTHYTGMTLRDWFAGQALAKQGAGTFGWSQKMIAKLAYEQADAMLRAREE